MAVPVSKEVPPVIELALRVSVARTGPPAAFTVSKALLDTLFAVATMVADPLPEELVSSVKSAEICPSGTVTEPGACTKLLVVASATGKPPTLAGAFRVTVPLTLDPALAELCARLNPTRRSALSGKRSTVNVTTFDDAFSAVTVSDARPAPSSWGGKTTLT